MEKDFLDQTPPGGTVVGGLGPAHGSEAADDSLELTIKVKVKVEFEFVDADTD